MRRWESEASLKGLLIFSFLLFHPLNVSAQVLLGGQIIGQDAIRICPPFKGFANGLIEKEYPLNGDGRFEMQLDIYEDIFVKLRVANRQVILLCQPGDTISLKSNPTKSSSDWLKISGNNASGNNYFNLVFNANPMTKFDPLSRIFEEWDRIDVEILMQNVFNEIENQTRWVDSLKTNNHVTEGFAELMRIQIRAQLAWHVGNLCNRYLKKDTSNIWKNNHIKNSLFSEIDANDTRLKRCLAFHAYEYTYYQHLGESRTTYDTTLVITPTSPFYTLAPYDFQTFLWGFSIYTNIIFSPAGDNYCKQFQKYNRLFPDGVWSKYLTEIGVCEKTTPSEITILDRGDLDFNTFCRANFRGQRIFIDMWATWCGPCKAEFPSYDSTFYAFLSQKGVKLVFLSIDDPKHKSRWENEIKLLNLKGYHILAGPNLKKSVTDIVFDNEPVSIPRYVLVDEAGKILSANFTRPSNASFKQEMNKLLVTDK